MNRQAAVSQSREHTYTIYVKAGFLIVSYRQTLPIHNVTVTLSADLSKEISAADTQRATVTIFTVFPFLTYSAEKAEPKPMFNLSKERATL